MIQEEIKELIVKASNHEKANEVLDDLVHDVKSKEASGINNEGIKAQITFLVESGCYQAANDALAY